MTRTEAREQIRKTLEGYMTDSIGAALEWLDSGKADELLADAEMNGWGAKTVLVELTGVIA